jgi:hypothetical protein
MKSHSKQKAIAEFGHRKAANPNAVQSPGVTGPITVTVD